MNLQMYQAKRRADERAAWQPRQCCVKCMQPVQNCYCRQVTVVDAKIKFVILIHPIEHRRRIATGRMAHLHLSDSHLIYGEGGRDFVENNELNQILLDPGYHSVMLYPGVTSLNLSSLSCDQRSRVIPHGRKLAVIVIDGTWATARRMARSENLVGLPRICFSPSHPSRFRVRKQPAPGCHSTLEAIHQTIELLAPATGFDISSCRHDGMLRTFDSLVERQIAVTREHQLKRGEVPRHYPTLKELGLTTR